MNTFGFAAVIASGLGAAVLGLGAPANAAPTGPGNAEQTISQLQAQGYNVIVNRLGASQLYQATVVAVRPGQTYSPHRLRRPRSRPSDNHCYRQDRIRRRQVTHRQRRGTPARGGGAPSCVDASSPRMPVGTDHPDLAASGTTPSRLAKVDSHLDRAVLALVGARQERVAPLLQPERVG